MSTSSGEPLSPGQTALHHHLAGPGIGEAESRGWLRVGEMTWPILVATIVLPAGELTLRLDLTGYPVQAPTGQAWDLRTDQPLSVERWPTGTRAEEVFSRGWSPSNGNALYLPLDRRAQVGHDGWANDHPAHWWSANKTVLDYLRLVRDVLRGASFPKAAA